MVGTGLEPYSTGAKAGASRVCWSGTKEEMIELRATLSGYECVRAADTRLFGAAMDSVGAC